MKVKLCKVYTLRMSTKNEICFRNNKIRESDTLERQTIGVNKYASTFRWLHAIRKGLITEKKRGVKKYENTQLFSQGSN